MHDPFDPNPKSPFKSAASGPPKPQANEIRPVARPVSKQQVNDLHKQLSAPRIALEYTMEGAITRQIRTERDQAILKEIEAIRARLELRRKAAKEAFKRGVDNTTVRSWRKP